MVIAREKESQKVKCAARTAGIVKKNPHRIADS
jgi:hypothetical protein